MTSVGRPPRVSALGTPSNPPQYVVEMVRSVCREMDVDALTADGRRSKRVPMAGKTQRSRANNIRSEAELMHNRGGDKSCTSMDSHPVIELQAKVEHLEAMLVAEQSRYHSVAAENAKLCNEKATDQKKIKALEEEVAKKEKELTLAAELKSKIQAEHTPVRKRLHKVENAECIRLQCELSKVAAQWSRLECLIMDREEQIECLTKELKDLKSQNVSLEEKLQAAEGAVQRLEIACQKLNGEKKALMVFQEASLKEKEHHQVIQRELGKELEAAHKVLVIAQENQVKREHALLTAMEEVQGELKHKQAALEKEQMLRNAPKTSCLFPTLLHEENELLRVKLIERDLEMEEMTQTHRDKAKALEEVDEKMALLEADVEQWRRDYKGCSSVKAMLQRENDSMKEHLHKLAVECNGCPARRIKDLKQMLAEERQYIVSLKTTVDDLQKELAETHAAKSGETPCAQE